MKYLKCQSFSLTNSYFKITNPLFYLIVLIFLLIGDISLYSQNTITNDAIYIDSTGRVGIGTNQPSTQFTMGQGAIRPTAGKERINGVFFPENPYGGAGDNAYIRYYLRAGDEDTNFEIGTGNDPADHIILNTYGHVGIGTSNPQKKLHVKGDVQIDSDVHTNGRLYLNGPITNNNPERNLVVERTMQTNRDIILDNFTGAQLNKTSKFLMRHGTAFGLEIQSFAGNHPQNGNVSAYSKFTSLEGSGRGGFIFEVKGGADKPDPNLVFYIDRDGNFNRSDERLKKNIRPLQDVLSKLVAIDGVTFQWKADQAKKPKDQIGFIAQQVQSQFPELVSNQVDGYLMVDYTKFTPILLEAIKQQQGQIAHLEQQLAHLEQQQTTQNKRLDGLLNGIFIFISLLLVGFVVWGVMRLKKRIPLTSGSASNKLELS